jgi:hypothetical protein
VLGIERIYSQRSKITLEGFYKMYSYYPFSVRDSISLANKGADYGTFGDEEVMSTSNGRAYGAELLYRLTNWKKSASSFLIPMSGANLKARMKHISPQPGTTGTCSISPQPNPLRKIGT